MANKMQNERLQLYITAERVVLSGQSYTIGGRTLTRASLGEIRKAIDSLLVGGATLAPAGESETIFRAKRVLFRDV